MAIKVAVSVGEVVDKLTILNIKADKIAAEWKREYIGREIHALQQALLSALGPWDTFEDLQGWFGDLKKINEELWVVEDELRVAMAEGRDREFLLLARAVPCLNEKRALVKDKINQKYDLEFREIKQFRKC